MSIDPSRLAELDFTSSSLEDWEIQHCWSHEFTRLVPDLVRLIESWRAQVPQKEGQNPFDAYLSHQFGRLSPLIQIEDRIFMIPLGAYYLFPEWPNHYLTIPSKVRFRRLKKLWEHEKDWLEPREKGTSGQKRRRKRGAVAMELREIDPHPAEYGLHPISGEGVLLQTSETKWDGGALNRFMDNLMENIRSKNEMRVFRSDAEVLAILRVRWELSDKQLLNLFSKWLACNRPVPFQNRGRLGRSNPLAKKKTELDYLRKYLIVRETGTWKTKVNGNAIFRDLSRWNDCRKAVEKILADLGSYPGCTS